MERETYISEIQDIIKKISEEYGNISIWICKRFGKRLSFFAGIKPDHIFFYNMRELFKNYFLFIEEKNGIDEYSIEDIVSRITNLLSKIV